MSFFLLYLRRILANRQRRKDLLQSGLFDREWYLQTYTDVGRSQDAMRHFLSIGSSENRSPGPSFDTKKYLARYRDVAQSGMEPWRHFYIHGQFEHRLPNSNEVMLDSYDDVRAALKAITGALTDLELRFQSVVTDELPLARLARMERISAQWQASIPRLVNSTRSGHHATLESRLLELEERVGAMRSSLERLASCSE